MMRKDTKDIATPQASVEDLAALLHARGERLTPQRMFVLEVLQEGSGHQSAEAIYERTKLKYPYINLATVYRTLTWLRDQGLISETDLGGGHTEYEALAAHRHHHLVCLACGGRIEFADELVAPLAAALREHYGFEPRLDHLAIFGLCRGCRAQT
jgi:Fur family transcriptional regulator, ferric uptake regulator